MVAKSGSPEQAGHAPGSAGNPAPTHSMGSGQDAYVSLEGHLHKYVLPHAHTQEHSDIQTVLSNIVFSKLISYASA